ncbi:NUDIX domain-containing protein [Streptomyces chrestomyceticus]|uniref:NUDIX domain-containing protein n=1 Tax=Streptomyces chrestomyceticus TaxID=68185 RepID=UPI003F4CC336
MTYTSPLWPVSVKGVAFDARGRVLLLRNERDEWELPGGRLEIGSAGGEQVPDPTPEAALEREVREETGLSDVHADGLTRAGAGCRVQRVALAVFEGGV